MSIEIEHTIKTKDGREIDNYFVIGVITKGSPYDSLRVAKSDLIELRDKINEIVDTPKTEGHLAGQPCHNGACKECRGENALSAAGGQKKME